MERITTSKKIEIALKDQGRNKSWLAGKLNISRPTLYSKLKDNFWQPDEIILLQSMNLI